jgi:hypothetical protein
MDRISDRHEGDLGGRLAPFAATRKFVVAVTVPKEVAGEAACQHTVWMLTNLLARSDGIVERVVIDCPDGVPLAGRVVPLADRHLELAEALRVGAAAIDGVPVEISGVFPAGATHLTVGPGAPVGEGVRVHGERWWGGVSTEGIDGTCDSELPYGPYAAATLAAAEIFKSARMRDYPGPVDAYYSLWVFRAAFTPPDSTAIIGPRSLHDVRIAATLAGVGAVGSAWVHVMWATAGIHGEAALADADERGVDTTNLNRCPIFGRASLGKRKASEAARICDDAPLSWRPHDGPVGEVADRPLLFLSAVDTNDSRQAIQGLYPPRLISASTLDMRAELLRCDPFAEAACIRCFNPIAQGPSDNDLRRRFVDMSGDEQQRLAREMDFTMEEAQAWAVEGKCGYVGDRIAARLRPTDQGAPAFAVGFVSVMAGAMLAAQTIKEAMNEGPLEGLRARAVMQFIDPTATTNDTGLYGRDPRCPMCDPTTRASAVWQRRYGAVRG